jgi:hypothetical protein
LFAGREAITRGVAVDQPSDRGEIRQGQQTPVFEAFEAEAPAGPVGASGAQHSRTRCHVLCLQPFAHQR